MILTKVIVIKKSVKIRRFGQFGDVAAYAATSPNWPKRRILTDFLITITLVKINNMLPEDGC